MLLSLLPVQSQSLYTFIYYFSADIKLTSRFFFNFPSEKCLEITPPQFSLMLYIYHVQNSSGQLWLWSAACFSCVPPESCISWEEGAPFPLCKGMDMWPSHVPVGQHLPRRGTFSQFAVMLYRLIGSLNEFFIFFLFSFPKVPISMNGDSNLETFITSLPLLLTSLPIQWVSVFC